ncbi:unannotated protein [freshwater metagenome]|uniref:Unannotated protein n=1 Tax=freshwater metagenome TaxID=449393 RepID=A0A6J6S1M9_9ZZZZ
MKLNAVTEPYEIVAVRGIEVDHLRIHSKEECAVGVINERQTSRHSRAKIPARWSEDHNSTTSHVLAAVVTQAFNDSDRATIADTETFADDAPKEHLPLRCAVKHDVASDDVVFRSKGCTLRRTNNDPTA